MLEGAPPPLWQQQQQRCPGRELRGELPLVDETPHALTVFAEAEPAEPGAGVQGPARRCGQLGSTVIGTWSPRRREHAEQLPGMPSSLRARLCGAEVGGASPQDHILKAGLGARR